MADLRKQSRTSRLSVAISAGLHALVIGALVFVAAREGILGKQLKKIAVTMVPKERLPEKPKEPPREKPPEPPPEPKPDVQPPKTEPTQPVALPAAASRTAAATAPAATAAAIAAPPPAALPAFTFEGGKAVETTSDPHVLYKSYVEYTLRSRWTRPEGIADEQYVAEVEVAIDASGVLLNTQWVKGSGDAGWDDSVRRVLAATKSIGRPPPKRFPGKVRIRFDVQVATELGTE